jgi:acetyl-CoA carboxylase biotin carboxylase subunit
MATSRSDRNRRSAATPRSRGGATPRARSSAAPRGGAASRRSAVAKSGRSAAPENAPVRRRPIRKVLIANRGEIAVRVIKALREMDIASVAVYSDVDRAALHVATADEAYALGGTTSLETYLRGDKLLEIAARAGADAVHPGYGFLAENADFARACASAGVAFIGPSPEAMHGMGDKIRARDLARQAGVPLVPGSPGRVESVAEAERLGAELGYPVMLKATAGGGGKGMRLAHDAAELRRAFERTADEARNAFGNPDLYLEKFIERPRHIEMQVFGDQHGNCVWLGERECTIQRRHQKVVEEAPSPLLTAAQRADMGERAAALAARVGYVGAGTVEFVADQSGNFYFLEMNTRLQVEHPVTELVTGIDLVKEQLRVAMGEPLSFLDRLPLEPRGWAIECRVYAEDPLNGFLPSIGRIAKLSVPYGPGVRNDFGVYEGYDIPVYYDPMLGKLAVWAEDRDGACARMRRALADLQIEGVRCNQSFLAWILQHPVFASGDVDTGFIERYFEPGVLAPTEAEMLHFVVVAAIRAYQQGRIPKLPQAQGDNRWVLSGRLHEGNI